MSKRKNLPQDGLQRHLWFSAKHADINDCHMPRRKSPYYTMDHGKTVRITCVTHKAKCPIFWDDAKYLGIGVYSHNE